MSKKEIYRQAYNSYISLCGLVGGMGFEESYKYLKANKYDVFHKDNELFDINLDFACLTINNINGKAVVNNKGIEVWNDTNTICLGDFSAQQLTELGEID